MNPIVEKFPHDAGCSSASWPSRYSRRQRSRCSRYQSPAPALRVLQEVAVVARQGARERRGVSALDERRLRQPQLGFELASVEFHGEARVDPIALLREHDPVGPAQNAPQLVQGDVEVVLALGGRGVTPQREPDLLAGAAPRMTQEVEQQLARLGVAPGGVGKSLA